MKLIVLALLTTWVAGLPRKEGKFSLFSVVTFKNEECVTTMAEDMNGICQTSEECTNGGGTASGNCASGFGVCCFYALDDCETDVTNNVTYIQQEEFPTAFVAEAAEADCVYSVTGSEDICQVRFDFVVGTFSDASAIGTCDGTLQDQVTITSPQLPGGVLTPTGQLCGTLTGQHVYVETAQEIADAATITINFGPAAFNMRSWKIKVTMIECNNPGMAPPGCTQFFTGITGTFSSFNKIAGLAQGQFLANQMYTICIRQEKGMCGINYKENDPVTGSFALADTFGSGTGAAACANEAICIPLNNCFCGDILSNTVGDTASDVIGAGFPAEVVVKSINAGAATGGPNGFELDYFQTPCA